MPDRPPRRSPRGRSPSPGPSANRTPRNAAGKPAEKNHEILFQQYFKSVNPRRTYAAQVKRAGNGNHFLVLTEGKRDDGAAEPRLARVFVFSEDFVEFFRLLKSAAEFIKAHPVPDGVKRRQSKRWAKEGSAARAKPGAAAADRNGGGGSAPRADASPASTRAPLAGVAAR